MLDKLKRILFIAVIGIGVGIRNAEGVATVFNLPPNTPGLQKSLTKKMFVERKENAYT